MDDKMTIFLSWLRRYVDDVEEEVKNDPNSVAAASRLYAAKEILEVAEAHG